MKDHSDHILPSDAAHGYRGGGPLHSVATVDQAGFMSAAAMRAVSRETSAPVTYTADFSVLIGERWLICNKAGTTTVTLPSAAANAGRPLDISTIQAQLVVSAASNVVPITGGAAGTAILAATDGAWASLVSDGTNWITMRKG